MPDIRGMQQTNDDVFGVDTFSWEEYNKHRPQYPDGLYHMLSNYMTEHNGTSRGLCIDYGSGNGVIVPALLQQCNIQRVIGSDMNARQLEESKALLHAEDSQGRFDTLVGAAGDLVSINEDSVDLVTAAESCHWFDRPKWMGEVARILKRSGTLAFWNYPPQCYIISHPHAAPACNRIFEYLFSQLGERKTLPTPALVVGRSLLDDFVVSSSDFHHVKRLKWLLPSAIESRIPRDALLCAATQPINEEKFTAGILPTTNLGSDCEHEVSRPSTAQDVFVRKSGWTIDDLMQYIATLSLPVAEFDTQEILKRDVKEIQDIVGGPNATFDVGWTLGMVLATRR